MHFDKNRDRIGISVVQQMKKSLAVNLLSILFIACLSTSGQTVEPVPPSDNADRGKKNSRPTVKSSEIEHPARKHDSVRAGVPVYFYEFTRAGFTYSPVRIEHDENGRGKISFQKDGSDELITDPIALSEATMDKIRESLASLNFLDSTDSYQHERDFSHLGEVSITVKKDGRERTVKFNWTENRNARDLMDEYRRIVNEYTWLFEFGVARENQPLRTPGMMDALDGYLRRNEIPDPPHLLSFLTALSNDERLPLMARNRATKLVKQIEKEKK